MIEKIFNRYKWCKNKISIAKLNSYQNYYSFKNRAYRTQKEISILNITPGRFGNKIFQLNNLMQAANKYDRYAVTNYWQELNFLDVPNLLIRKPKSGEFLKCEDFYSGMAESILLGPQNIHLSDNFLHNYFFDFCVQQPRKIIFIKEKYKCNAQKKNNVLGIHIRGGDIISADGNQGFELHDIGYYRRAIKYIVENYPVTQFLVCTDDKQISTYHDVLYFLNSTYKNKIKVELGLGTKYPRIYSYIYDFAALSEVDYLISSSSTFSTAAAILGRDKKIIHSKDWLDRVSEKFETEYDTNYGKPILRNQVSFWSQVQLPNNFYNCNLVI